MFVGLCMEKDKEYKECHTVGSCPFAYSFESERVQNYGCIPTPQDIITMRVKHDKTWACHSAESKPCLGAIKFLKREGLPYEVKELVSLDDKWWEYSV